MKNTFYFFALLLLAIPFTLKSQDVPPAGTPVMTMTVQPNSSINFYLGRAGGDGRIWIDAGDGNYTPMDITYNWYGLVTVNTLGDYVKIYGSLRNFEAVNQNISHFDVTQMSELRYLDVEGNWITELDLSQNFLMEKLYFNYNHLSEMDLSHCTQLTRLYARQNRLTKLLVSPESGNMEIVYCDGNLLEACALDSLFVSLPSSSTTPSIIMEVKGDGSNPGNYTSHTSIATDKGWLVLKWVSSQTFDPIVGDGTGCITSVNEISDAQLSVFPNPTTSEMNIRCEEVIRNIEIVNILGQIVEKHDNLNRQSVHLQLNHQTGIYFLKIYTENGFTTQKIMIQ